jgi:ABC-2 type transport system ATP-binding protein
MNHINQSSYEEPVIEVNDVYKSFKTVKAVQGISLRISAGQFVALLGPNGAGKTTLVEMIEGIQKPDQGEIKLLGKHWKGNKDELHRHIGLSLQETRYIDKLTVNETLMLFASFYDLGQQRVDEIINLIGLAEKRKAYVVNLSGGQRQKLALGISLLNNPKILLLDEPTTGLDPNARREIWSILFTLKEKSHTSLILTTHYMEEAEQLCDYIIIIDSGKILREGTINQLLNEDHEQKFVEFTLEKPAEHADLWDAKNPFPIHWNEHRTGGTITLSEMNRDLPEFLNYLGQNNQRLQNIECRRRTLDDLFTSLTGRQLNA